MAPPIIIEELFPDKVVELGKISGAEPMIVGREPEFGIKIPNGISVSREHGVLIPFGDHWIYKDLGSTNGSSHRGEVILPEEPVVVRLGEIVEMAGHLIRISLDTSEGATPPPPRQSILVFQRTEPKKEYFTADTKTADSSVILAIGGKHSSYKLEIDIEEHPSLIVEHRGQAVVAYSVSKAGGLTLNGAPIAAPMTLKDRDVLSVGLYRCIFLDELYKSVGATTKVALWDDPEQQPLRKPSAGYKAQRSFGQLPDSKGTPKTEAFVGRRIVASAGIKPPKQNPLSTGVILILLFIFCGGLGLLVAYLM